MTINYSPSEDLNLPSGLTINGDLTVNAPNATVNNNATVSGTINIKDVKAGTWNELVSVNTLVFDAKGKTLNLPKGVAGLTINANATVITPKPVQATVAEGITVTVKGSPEDNGREYTGTAGGGEIELDPAPEAERSTYEFDFTIPENVVEREENEISVTFRAKEIKDEGYNKVRFIFNTTNKPENSTVTFKATDTNNNEHTFTDSGVWGPDTGFPISKDYTATTPWKVIFSAAGNYTIEFKLIDLENESNEIATGTATIEVKEPPTPTTYTVKFTVTPANATVEIKDSQDNVIEAETDGTYKLEVGTYTYTVSAEGYVTQTDTFMVAQGDQTITVNLVLDEKAVALATINSVVAGDNYGQNERQEMRKALEENAETLGLDLTEYNKITVDGRKDAVGWDLLANRPEGGYSVATLQSMLNEIVLTRQTTEVSLNMVNEAESLGDIEFAIMLLDRFQASEDNNYKIHSGLLVTEKINTLQDLKNRYDNLASDANRDKVLQKIIEGRPYARSQATTDALNTALTEVEAEIETLLQEVNSADESGMKAIIADSVKAEILGLETGENSRYFELAEGRRPAVATDLYYNRPKEGGYNPATYKNTSMKS